jgi:YD repeat-containing protein
MIAVTLANLAPVTVLATHSPEAVLWRIGSTIGGAAVSYDAGGNLSRDEAGRYFDYNEANRLSQVRAADGTTVLAGYTYDALGRRITATIGGTTTRYYYDGQTVIEERDGGDARLRYHINGSQYIDERVATYTDATGQFTYYLLADNLSVTGTGNADGSVIHRLDYSAARRLPDPPRLADPLRGRRHGCDVLRPSESDGRTPAASKEQAESILSQVQEVLKWLGQQLPR